MTDALPNLVLLPGMMCDHNLWADMVPELGRHVRLHFGDLSRGETLDGLASDVLQTAPDQFHLCGFSMGGYVARELCAMAPDRVRSLVLINTSARGITSDELMKRQNTVQLIEDRPFKGLTSTNLRESVHPARATDDALLERIQTMALGLGKEVFLRQLAMPRTDGHATLGQITCRTLVLAARNDKLRTLAESQELADGIAGAQFKIFDECGHMTPLEQPGALNKVLIDWITS